MDEAGYQNFENLAQNLPWLHQLLIELVDEYQKRVEPNYSWYCGVIADNLVFDLLDAGLEAHPHHHGHSFVTLPEYGLIVDIWEPQGLKPKVWGMDDPTIHEIYKINPGSCWCGGWPDYRDIRSDSD